MAPLLSFESDVNQVICEEKQHWLRKIILNRPHKLNSLDYKMVSKLKKILEEFEVDDKVGLVLLTGNEKVFSVGGDLVKMFDLELSGHWSFVCTKYKKILLLDYLVATYKKPLVILINGLVMGAGAGLSMNGRFRIVTENTVFAMPEASIGLHPDVGASYFLSRLPGCFGEYLGLTGARINGIEMFECGLATHFVLSKNLKSLEEELEKEVYVDGSAIPYALEKFSHKPNLQQKYCAYRRLDIIDKCFSKNTVEDILSALESEVVSCGDKWMVNAIKSMKSASPTSLKICLKSIRDGRKSELEECLRRDYIILSHMIRKSFHNDFLEGLRAKLLDKDKSPKWKPAKLEEVSDEYVNKFFQDISDDDHWDYLTLPNRKITEIINSKL